MNAPPRSGAGPAADRDPQVVAADPAASAFVSANAGAGKTKTLVDRVARLLLGGARPEAILCVTYTKAAAAEMQRRLFQQLGAWSMMPDATLTGALARIGEAPHDLSRARVLFAQALETPGGLKIQTLHAFCEKLLRRFPLEAGVSPGFAVLDDAEAADITLRARDAVAQAAMADHPGLADAYARFAATLDFQAFERMFSAFEEKREAIAAYVAGCGGLAELPAAVAAACGLQRPQSPGRLKAEALSPPNLDPALWREGAQALAASGERDRKCAAQMAAVAEAAERGEAAFADALSVFCTAKGEPAKWLDTAKALKSRPVLHQRLVDERERLLVVAEQARSAQVAEDTVHALTLAWFYAVAFEQAKAARGVLDFADLVERTKALLSRREDAAWVLYKLDGGIDHVLLDEAQDTAPAQWDILRALTGEFFSGAGARGADAPRTVFIVGDEKQSIYSFQGAAPERLSEEAARYGQAAADAAQPFARVPLLASWRSTPEVLRFVDAVFEPQGLRAALQPRPATVADEGAVIRHIANRREHAGAIDLWPLEQEAASESRRAWDEPLDVEAARGAYRRLAEKIAGEIKGLVERGEQVHDAGTHRRRPAGYGDVLILVRKRRTLFQELLRALKHRGVPVAGADRMVLSEHPVFEDLIAFARILLFPHDDLTLAAALRSPLCDVDEDGLFELAHGRSGSLWSALRRRAGERMEWESALSLFAWAAAEATRRSPFELYGRLLARLDGSGRSMRQRFLTRLGPEAGDALDEFLAQALAAEGRGVFDLERFADAVSRLRLTVKREMDEPRGEVRVMTAHSAKGLEAPVVILPETVSGGAARGSPLLETPDGGFLWCASKGDDCPASARVRALREQKDEQEAMRLLYVALTRARDRVIVAGRIHARADPDRLKGWWPVVCSAFDHPSIAAEVREVAAGEMTVRRFGPDPAISLSAAPAAPAPARLPAWAHQSPAREADPTAYTAPSAGAEAANRPGLSPLSRTFGLGRFRRGTLIHRLLQVLPDLSAGERTAGAAMLLDKERDLTPEQRREMAAAALGVLLDPRFEAVFGPGSHAEAAIAGTAPDLPPGLRIAGRVDRMTLTADRVLVVDFKTNRPAPNRVEEADPTYLTQMALYAAVLRAVFPQRTVEAALVWTDGPRLMPLPAALLAERLAMLRSQP